MQPFIYLVSAILPLPFFAFLSGNLLIHSRDDELISFSHARQIAAQTHHIPIETYFVHHASHGGAYGSDPEQYVTRLKHFLAQQIADA